MSDMPRKVVVTGTRHAEHWEVDVEFDSKWVGGGTGPSPYDVLGIASDILFGDDNDYLNDYHGALGQIIEDQRAAASAAAHRKEQQ